MGLAVGRCHWLIAGAMLLAPVALGAADPPAKSPPSKEEPAVRDVDSLKIPPEAILVICKEVAGALRLIPEGVVLSPEAYQGLMERIDQLQRQTKPAKYEIPSTCKLTGQVVEGDLVRFQAQFEFRTDRPRAVVSLGCQRAWLKPGAILDGKLPLLQMGDEGLVLVQVETPGVHLLSLDLEVPLVSRDAKGMEQGFDLGLPRAAITTLEQFTFPRPLREVRINNRTVRTKAVDGQHSRLEAVPLGPAERLDMAWKGPGAAQAQGQPLREALGRLVVKVSDTSILTDAELNLRVVGGETRTWQIQIPPNVVPEIKEPRPQDERIEAIDLPAPNSPNPVLTIRLKEASSSPLRVVLQARQKRGKLPVSIGPFFVPGAFRQRGTIAVSAPPELRLRYHLRGEAIQREVSEESRRDNAVAEFVYSNLPAASKPAQPAPAPLTMEVEEVKGAVEARVEHTLQLAGSEWRVATKISITPLRTRIDHLDLEIPSGYQYDEAVGATPAEAIDRVDMSERPGGGRLARIKFIKDQSQPFTVTLPGLYPLAGDQHQATFDLPRPLQTLDRGGQVTASVPEGLELAAAETDPGILPSGERQHTWRSERFPNRVEVGWRPHRPDFPVETVVDLTVAGRQILVRQRLRLLVTPTASRLLPLTVPASVAPRLRIVEGGTLQSNGMVKLANLTGKDHTVVLDYSFDVSSRETAEQKGKPSDLGSHLLARRFPVPLVRVAQATRSQTTVWVWSPSGAFPTLIQGGAWFEPPGNRRDLVPDRQTLPGLVVQSQSLDAPLVLALTESPAVIIDQALVQVEVASNGSQKYRARFQVSRLPPWDLDIEFPIPLSRLSPELILGGKKVTRWRPLEIPGPEGADATVARLEVRPDLYRTPFVLEVRYQLPPESVGGASRWYSRLSPPRLRDAVLLNRVRWQIDLPAGWIAPFQWGGQLGEQAWGWRGLLWAPRPTLTRADLEGSLVAGLPEAVSARDASVAPADGEPSLVCWQTALEPLSLVRASQQVWLLACSLLFLVVGLGLSFAPRSPTQFWVATLLVILTVAGGAILAAIWWPGVVPEVIYGCEPGIVVLLLILGVQWMLHQHYRRRVIFLPSFTRLRPGSSLVRKEASSRPRGEPSTVDAPPMRGSSAKHPLEGGKQ